jgi:aminoglycoside/choline kinase family phosphotransferase
MIYSSENIIYELSELLKMIGETDLVSVTPIQADASERKLFRIITAKKSYIGVFNEYIDENVAFIEFSKAFKNINLNVPEIYIVNAGNNIYIEEDLGDITLFYYSRLYDDKIEIISKYKTALKNLLQFQIEGNNVINYDYCYQTQSFNEKMLIDDFNKFKNYFGSLSALSVNEINISRIFEIVKEKILQNEYEYFMYRDFQPRNIMIKNEELFFIDFQSGRRGPLQYDVASFLYSGSINLNYSEREELLDYYLNELESNYKIDRKNFMKKFYYYVFARLIQVLGSYSYLYTVRKDESLLKKIPKAINNLKSISDEIKETEIKNFIDSITHIAMHRSD